jgi:hypothetical protein
MSIKKEVRNELAANTNEAILSPVIPHLNQH